MDLDPQQISTTDSYSEKLDQLSDLSMLLTDETILTIPEADVPLEDENDRLAQALVIEI